MPPPRATPVPAAPAPRARGGRAGVWLAVLLALAAALAAGGALWTSRLTLERQQGFEADFARRQQNSDGAASEARSTARQAQDSALASAAKVALVEARVAEVVVQRDQLDDLIQSLSRSRDDSVLLDVEAGLRVAQQQAAITGSVEPLLIALRQSDETLARLGQPRLEGVRAAISSDRDRIRAVGVADLATINQRLGDAVRLIDELPLLSQAARTAQLAGVAASAGSAPAAAAPASAAAAVGKAPVKPTAAAKADAGTTGSPAAAAASGTGASSPAVAVEAPSESPAAAAEPGGMSPASAAASTAERAASAAAQAVSEAASSVAQPASAAPSAASVGAGEGDPGRAASAVASAGASAADAPAPAAAASSAAAETREAAASAPAARRADADVPSTVVDTTEPSPVTDAGADEAPAHWTRIQRTLAGWGHSIWGELRSLVRVSRVDNRDAMLVAPEQAYFIRENLKLRLLNARLSVLSRQFDIAQGDLQAARDTLGRYFDRSSNQVVAVEELLRQVSEQARQTQLPRPDETLSAIAAIGGPR